MCAGKKRVKKQSVAFTLEPSTVEWLRKAADKDERSMSYVVNKVLKEKAEQEEKTQ